MNAINPAFQTHESILFRMEQVKKKQRVKSLLKGLLFLSPSIILFTTFVFYPMFKTIYLSFFLTDAAGNATVFVGWDNYINMFSSPVFLKSMKNTFLFVLYTVPITIIIALFLAVIANEKLKGIGFFRTIFSSTMGISVAAASVFWLYLFNPTMGLINQILNGFGIESIGWLTDPNWALPAISVTTIWMNIGFTFLILLGGLQSIDSSLYESADIEGFGYFYKTSQNYDTDAVTNLILVITVSIINAFQTFDKLIF